MGRFEFFEELKRKEEACKVKQFPRGNFGPRMNPAFDYLRYPEPPPPPPRSRFQFINPSFLDYRYHAETQSYPIPRPEYEYEYRPEPQLPPGPLPQYDRKRSKYAKSNCSCSCSDESDGETKSQLKPQYISPDRSRGDFYCKFCDAHMNCELTWHSHLRGKRHQQNVQNPPEESPSKIRVLDAKDKTSVIQREMEELESPVVGLNHVVEIRKNDPTLWPTYTCYLCSANLSAKETLTKHVYGINHQLAYLRLKHPRKLYSLEEMNLSRKNLEAVVKTEAFEMELAYGRGIIAVKYEKPRVPYVKRDKPYLRRKESASPRRRPTVRELRERRKAASSTSSINTKSDSGEQTLEEKVSALQNQVQMLQKKVDEAPKTPPPPVPLEQNTSQGETSEIEPEAFAKAFCEMDVKTQMELIMCRLKSSEVHDEDVASVTDFCKQLVSVLVDHKQTDAAGTEKKQIIDSLKHSLFQDVDESACSPNTTSANVEENQPPSSPEVICLQMDFKNSATVDSVSAANSVSATGDNHLPPVCTVSGNSIPATMQATHCFDKKRASPFGFEYPPEVTSANTPPVITITCDAPVTTGAQGFISSGGIPSFSGDNTASPSLTTSVEMNEKAYLCQILATLKSKHNM